MTEGPNIIYGVDCFANRFGSEVRVRDIGVQEVRGAQGTRRIRESRYC